VCGRPKISTHGPPTRVRNPRRAQIFSGNFLHRWWKTSVYVAHSLFLFLRVLSCWVITDPFRFWNLMASERSDSRIGRPTPRRRSAVTTYSENQLVYDSNVHWEFLTIQERLEQLHRCVQLGFDSIYEASLEEAKTPPTGFHDTKQHMKEFAQNGQF
jgi:hypothetical protein